MATRPPGLPDDVLFAVCEQFINRQTTTKIAEWVEKEGYPCTREQIYRHVQRGLKRGFLRLHPPEELVRAQDLRRRYPQAADVRVVNVRGASVYEHLGSCTADLVLSLIKDVQSVKDRVHLGFGAGRTTSQVAQSLGRLLELERGLPDITIHALSSGFATHEPLTAPSAFFSYFSEVEPSPDYVGLFAPAVVKYKEYEKVKNLPGVHESFEAAGEIDIVITSLASAEDDHGLLNRFFRLGKNTKGLRNLEKEGWVGDVQWRPYSEEGPIQVDTGIRAVTLFELEELKTMVATGKHVILVAGPCNRCGASKAMALKPLIEKENLRVFNHLVTDVGTAEELL